MSRYVFNSLVGFTSTAFLFAFLSGTGCPSAPDTGMDSAYNNTTDRTNAGAPYLGSEACRACHPGIDEDQSIHGHAHKLTPVFGQAPEFPAAGLRAGVPDPPDGFDWSEIAWMIGGYTRKARFIDQDGFVLTTGVEGVDTQWNLLFPANGTEPGFVPYEAGAESPKPYAYSCFVCHTTGPMPQDEDEPQFQENRPGFIGTWQEPGVQCESCHGPGSRHVANPSARDLFVDNSAQFCGECHNRPFDSDGSVILASGGYIKHHEQYPELLASGGHATFDCVTCHKPHVSTNYDRDNAIRNECTACHTNATMALHEGLTFERGDYTEVLGCESCHMPFATRSATSASAATVGDVGRLGDTRTHIFRISTENADFTSMFNADMSAVAKDGEGNAAVTVDFVCIRCHNGIGNAFELSVDSASEIAIGMHLGIP